MRSNICRADDLRLPLSAYAENGDPPRKARRDLVTALTNHLSHERGKSWKELKNALENLSRSELSELVTLLVGRMSHFLRESPEPMETTGFPRLEE